jgi:hypothetical protein
MKGELLILCLESKEKEFILKGPNSFLPRDFPPPLGFLKSPLELGDP